MSRVVHLESGGVDPLRQLSSTRVSSVGMRRVGRSRIALPDHHGAGTGDGDQWGDPASPGRPTAHRQLESRSRRPTNSHRRSKPRVARSWCLRELSRSRMARQLPRYRGKHFGTFTSAIPRPNRAGPLPQGRRGALRAHLGDHSQQGGGPVGPGDIAVRLNLWPLTVKANNVDNFGGWMVLPDQANYLTRDAGEHMMAD